MKLFDDENFGKKIIKFKNDVERLFYFHFGFLPIEDLPYSFKTNSAPIDIYINKNYLSIEIELPGISKENIFISVHDNILVIRWKSEPKIKPEVNFYCLERRFGRFERFVLLPAFPSTQNIKAVLSDGVLKINFEIGDIFTNSETLVYIS